MDKRLISVDRCGKRNKIVFVPYSLSEAESL